jgi:LPXTG-motif cell wall-anchored protein
MKSLMKYAVLTLVLTFGASVAANAAPLPPCKDGGPSACSKSAPEVDPSLAGAGIALLGGTLVVLRARRRKDPQ